MMILSQNKFHMQSAALLLRLHMCSKNFLLVGGHPSPQPHQHIHSGRSLSLYLALAFKASTGSSAHTRPFKVSDASPKEARTTSPTLRETSLGTELLQLLHVEGSRMSQECESCQLRLRADTTRGLPQHQETFLAPERWGRIY